MLKIGRWQWTDGASVKPKVICPVGHHKRRACDICASAEEMFSLADTTPGYSLFTLAISCSSVYLVANAFEVRNSRARARIVSRARPRPRHPPRAAPPESIRKRHRARSDDDRPATPDRTGP